MSEGRLLDVAAPEEGLEEGASSKPLPDLPPPVPPKSPPAAKPLPPLPQPDDFSEDEDDDEVGDDDAPLLSTRNALQQPALRVPRLKAPPILRRKPAARYVYVLYTITLLCSAAVLSLLVWSYSISLRAPFEKTWFERQLDSYNIEHLGLPQIMILSGVDVIWCCIVLFAARKGVYSSLLFLNVIFDFGQWALLIAFAVVNMVDKLYERRLCEGSKPETKQECDAASDMLLRIELTATSLALLVAVFHFILLVARCCMDVPPAWKRFGQIHERWELAERGIDESRRIVPGQPALDPTRLAPPQQRFGNQTLSSKISGPFGSSREGTIRL